MGITGGVGSGKSRVLEILKEEYGFRVIQADQVAKDLMQPGQESYRAVVDFLGTSILNEDGTINRPAMAQVIFGCPDKRIRGGPPDPSPGMEYGLWGGACLP